jgi:hypothetical protein
MPAQTVIQIRRDTAANWESTDPTLASGEIGFDTTNNQIKIGNGSDEWTVLDYASGGASVQISETAPADPDAGNVWFNSTDGRAYIYYDSVWVDLNPGIAGPPGKFTVSETAPSNALSGDGWFNSDTARLFIRYDNFWVEATSNYIGPTGSSGVIAVTSPITNSGTSTSATLGLDTSNIAPIANPTFTGTVNGNAGTPANAHTAKAIGFIGLPQVILASGGLTLSAAHAGDHIYVTGTGQTITIPANTAVPLEIGTTIVVINAAAVTTTIAITNDTLLQAGTGTTGSRTLAAHGMATLVKITATSWIISGNGIS